MSKAKKLNLQKRKKYKLSLLQLEYNKKLQQQ